MGLLASDVRVSVPSHDSVNSFGSFSAVRAWMPKTSGTNANAAVLVMHLIALLAPHGASATSPLIAALAHIHNKRMRSAVRRDRARRSSSAVLRQTRVRGSD